MTTGMLRPIAVLTGRASASVSSGARQMPSTPSETNCSTTLICSARSSSFSGPFQIISTPASSAALRAPASTVFQKTWVVPLGMTAMRFPLAPPPPAGWVVEEDEDDVELLLSHADSAAAAQRHRHRASNRFIAGAFRERDCAGKYIGSGALCK